MAELTPKVGDKVMFVRPTTHPTWLDRAGIVIEDAFDGMVVVWTNDDPHSPWYAPPEDLRVTRRATYEPVAEDVQPCWLAGMTEPSVVPIETRLLRRWLPVAQSKAAAGDRPQRRLSLPQVEELLARLDWLATELAETQRVLDRTATLLTSTADALKGPPAELHSHDWSDLPAVAARLVAERDRLAERVAGLPEWRCPSCGAVTRARMADHHNPAAGDGCG